MSSSKIKVIWNIVVWVVMGAIVFAISGTPDSIASTSDCESKVMRCLSLNESMRSYCLASAARLPECKSQESEVKLIKQRVDTYQQSVNADIPLVDSSCINAFDLSWSSKLAASTRTGADYEELTGQLDQCSARAQFRIPRP